MKLRKGLPRGSAPASLAAVAAAWSTATARWMTTSHVGTSGSTQLDAGEGRLKVASCLSRSSSSRASSPASKRKDVQPVPCGSAQVSLKNTFTGPSVGSPWKVKHGQPTSDAHVILASSRVMVDTSRSSPETARPSCFHQRPSRKVMSLMSSFFSYASSTRACVVASASSMCRSSSSPLHHSGGRGTDRRPAKALWRICSRVLSL
mmetsp:Transcript_56781/g.182416  ORF Transcript_56781/g.182416 Transcript_56781/m.182416 type:complete len:205 (-) Transcript_56781:2052-2666(-)